MYEEIFVTHCDTISCLLDSGKSLFDNDLHINIQHMMKYNHYTQFFAAFIDPKYKNSATQRCLDIINKFNEEIAKNTEYITFCKSYSDLKKSKLDKKISAFLSIEGAECIDSVETLYKLYDLGVRCIALTWNYSNKLATGVLDFNPKYGLSEFGKDILREMNKLGIIADVSHLSDKAFWDVIEVSTKPVIASHSNARAICRHRRNLTDEQFMAVCQKDGCVGINLYPLFLHNSGNAGIDDIIKHIEHFLNLGGENHIGIGADFDGVDYLPKGVASCEDVNSIFYKLLKLGYSENVIFKIKYLNFEDILNKIM